MCLFVRVISDVFFVLLRNYKATAILSKDPFYVSTTKARGTLFLGAHEWRSEKETSRLKMTGEGNHTGHSGHFEASAN